MTDFAAPEQLPALLRTPPWASGQRLADPPQLELPPLVQAPRVDMTEAERRRLTAPPETVSHWLDPQPMSQAEALACLGVGPEGVARVLAGEALRAEDLSKPTSDYHDQCRAKQVLSVAAVVALWNAAPLEWSPWGWTCLGASNNIQTLLAHAGTLAVPGYLVYTAQRPVWGLDLGVPLDTPELAVIALRARRRMKVALKASTEWLLAHPQTSARVMLRQLFGADDDAREDVRAALHVLAERGLRQALLDAADGLGAPVRAALDAELDADPLLRLPARMPKLPTWFDVAKVHRPRLRDSGAALPDDAVRHLVLMLAISRPEQPYAGLEAVRAACVPASLAEFAWDVHELWWAADAPSKDAWAFGGLALFGDEGTAHRMGPRAMRLARDGLKARAIAMIDLLAAGGSDAALMHLSHLADHCKVTRVGPRAREQVEAIAQQRGLSRIELADRIVPTLGLDDPAARVLDFGPRRFRIAFDQELKPFVRDDQGVRLKDLPKPRQTDDAALADAAVLRYKRLKSELKTVSRAQVRRLEHAMVAQRSWHRDEFERFFVQHPLTRELAARLLWAVLDADGRPIGACRIAEDGTLADARDDAFEPPADARFAIAHPVRTGADTLAAFGAQFADYEILQPFPQLAREVFALEPGEAEATRLSRVHGRDVATGAVIGMLDQGWLRGDTGDGGMIGTIDRPIGSDGVTASLWLDPGMFVGQLSSTPRQTLGELVLHDAAGHPVPFGRIDPLACSELLRDILRLAPYPTSP
jgi:hypothetical protein